MTKYSMNLHQIYRRSSIRRRFHTVCFDLARPTIAKHVDRILMGGKSPLELIFQHLQCLDYWVSHYVGGNVTKSRRLHLASTFRWIASFGDPTPLSTSVQRQPLRSTSRNGKGPRNEIGRLCFVSQHSRPGDRLRARPWRHVLARRFYHSRDFFSRRYNFIGRTALG